jgi:GTP-binding protein
MPVAVDRPRRRRAQRTHRQVFGFMGLERVEVEEARAGDIIAFSGPRGAQDLGHHLRPGEGRGAARARRGRADDQHDFETNTSPFFGQEGKFVTSRRCESGSCARRFRTCAPRRRDRRPGPVRRLGRGELHLGILIENMRREGYELAVSRPQVVVKEEGGERSSPGSS